MRWRISITENGFDSTTRRSKKLNWIRSTWSTKCLAENILCRIKKVCQIDWLRSDGFNPFDRSGLKAPKARGSKGYRFWKIFGNFSKKRPKTFYARVRSGLALEDLCLGSWPEPGQDRARKDLKFLGFRFLINFALKFLRAKIGTNTVFDFQGACSWFAKG